MWARGHDTTNQPELSTVSHPNDIDHIVEKSLEDVQRELFQSASNVTSHGADHVGIIL